MEKVGLWELFFLGITRPRDAFTRSTKEQRIKLFLILVFLAGLAGAVIRIEAAEILGLSGIIGFFIGSVLMMLLITGVGWMIMSLVLLPLMGGGRSEYMDALGVIGLSWVPQFFYFLYRAIHMGFVGEPLVIENNIALALFENLNPFVLWNVALQAIGFAVVFKSSLNRAIIFTVLYRVMLLLGSLAMVYRVLL